MRLSWMLMRFFSMLNNDFKKLNNLYFIIYLTDITKDYVDCRWLFWRRKKKTLVHHDKSCCFICNLLNNCFVL